MFHKNFKLILAVLVTAWSVYEFTQGNIMNGISILLLAGIFILFYFSGILILFENNNGLMRESEKIEKIKLDSSDKSFHAFGYSHIFEKRIKWYLKYINALKFLGIIVPLTIGAIALGYGANNNILLYAIIVGTPVIILQLIISTLSIVYKWDDELAYSFEATSDYNNLYDEFRKLFDFPTQSSTELEKKFEVLNAKLNSREQQNSKHKITEKELRIGMRYSLREHKKECAGCTKTPTDMKSTQCGVCGNF